MEIKVTKTKNTDIFAQDDVSEFRTIKSKSSTYVINEQTHKNRQQNLPLKKFIQISVSFCLKAKHVPLSYRGIVLARRIG